MQAHAAAAHAPCCCTIACNDIWLQLGSLSDEKGHPGVQLLDLAVVVPVPCPAVAMVECSRRGEVGGDNDLYFFLLYLTVALDFDTGQAMMRNSCTLRLMNALQLMVASLVEYKCTNAKQHAQC